MALGLYRHTPARLAAPLTPHASNPSAEQESVQTFGRKKSAVAVSYCKKGRGLVKINGCPIELVEPDLLRYKVFEPILLLGRERFSIMDLRIRVKGGGYTSQIYGACTATHAARGSFGAESFAEKTAAPDAAALAAGRTDERRRRRRRAVAVQPPVSRNKELTRQVAPLCVGRLSFRLQPSGKRLPSRLSPTTRNVRASPLPNARTHAPRDADCSRAEQAACRPGTLAQPACWLLSPARGAAH